nr:ribonuclease H-like domain-containing protein [Tanacetum cinerariifolium]
MAQTPPRNHALIGHPKHYASMPLLNPQRHVVPIVVVPKSKLVPINVARPVSTAISKIKVTRPRQDKPIITKPNLPPRRHINHSPSLKASTFPPIVIAVKAPMVNAAQGCSGKIGMETKMSSLRPCFSQHKCINEPQKGNPKYALNDKGVIDSECLRHMTRNMSYISDFEELNGRYVAFGGNPNGGNISGKDENQVLLKVPRENNMYNVNLKNIVPSGDLTCLFAKAALDESNLWHRRLGHINFKTINKLVKGNLVRGLPSKVFENDHTCVACKKGKQHKASYSLGKFDGKVDEGFLVGYSVVVLHGCLILILSQRLRIINPSLQAINLTLVQVSKNNLMQKKQGRKMSNYIAQSKTHDDKTKREAKGKSPVESLTSYRNLSAEFEDFSDNNINEDNAAGTLVPAVEQLFPNSTNTFSDAGPSNVAAKLEDITYSDNEDDVGAEADFNNLETSITDPLGKFQGKVDEGFHVGYFVCSKAFRNNKDAHIDGKEHNDDIQKYVSPDIHSSSYGDQTREQGGKAENKDKVSTARLNFTNSTNDFSAAGPLNAAMPNLEDLSHNADDVGAEADINNMESIISVSPILTTRIHKDHPTSQIIGDLSSTTQTRSMARGVRDQGEISQMFNEDFHTCMFACFLSQEEPKRIHQALKDPSWIEAMQEELIQFKMQKVWILVDLPYGKRAIGFEDPEYPDKVYKVVKALYGLHKAHRAWYETLATYLLENGFKEEQ